MFYRARKMCRSLSDFQLKRISSPFIPNPEAAGHYHLVHWWGVWHIIFADLPRVRWKPRCFCYISVHFDNFSSGFGLCLTFGFRLSCFVFVSFCQKVHEGVLCQEIDRLQNAKTTSPDPMHPLELFIFIIFWVYLLSFLQI